jgi:hypothetical protein
MDEVLSLIRSQVTALTAESQFRNWLEDEGPDETCEIVFNNSYIYRQNLKTNKNDLYFGCTLSGERVVDVTVWRKGISFNSFSSRRVSSVLTNKLVKSLGSPKESSSS